MLCCERLSRLKVVRHPYKTAHFYKTVTTLVNTIIKAKNIFHYFDKVKSLNDFPLETHEQQQMSHFMELKYKQQLLETGVKKILNTICDISFHKLLYFYNGYYCKFKLFSCLNNILDECARLSTSGKLHILSLSVSR